MNERTHRIIRIISRVLVFALVLGLLPVVSGCGGATAQDDIIILFTNDVHCSIDENIGYAGLAAYEALCKEETPYVALVDCGDAIQGEAIGALSEGEYVVEIMNHLEYDAAIFGNHEFDFGIEQLGEIVKLAKYPYLNCNITYSGKGENILEGTEDHLIQRYGNVDVAFVGVSTPETITAHAPAYFKEDGEFVYDFAHGSAQTFYSTIQAEVDECRQEGAEYVVLLCHLGESEGSVPFTSMDVVHNVSGVTAVLDGHSHSVTPMRVEKDKSGKEVPICSTGTGLSNIGRLTISAQGTVTTTLISSFAEKDEETAAFVESIKERYNDFVDDVVLTTEYPLSVSGADGIRRVRCREMPIGNLCADAYRVLSGSDIAFVNGGAIRADLEKGDITYGDLLAVYPYGNYMCTAEATGQEILDDLEAASYATEGEAAKDGTACGEAGCFRQVSGLRYTIDTSIPSSVEYDADGLFLKVAGPRRVKNVEVLQKDGTYRPIDPKAIYTVTGNNHAMKDGGDGISLYADNNYVIDEGILDYQALIEYVNEVLKGDLSGYQQPEGRITVK